MEANERNPDEMIAMCLRRSEWIAVFRAIETALDEGQAGDIDAFVTAAELHEVCDVPDWVKHMIEVNR